MKTLLLILYLIVFLSIWLTVLSYYLRMFQQNSYKPDRFLKWLPDFVGVEPFRYRKKYKVRFVVTSRVVRLALVSTLLAGTVVYFFRPWGLITVLLVPYLLLCANWLLIPVERAINLWYCRDAARRLAQRPDLIIIGITGSYGKTSTKNFLHRILSEKYNVLITPGNYNTTLGVVRTIREQLQPYHQVFIVEMGAKQPGDIKEICDLVHPTIGIVTAVGGMHLETFKTIEAIQRTKFELLRALPSDGLGVINWESEGISSYEDIPDHCSIVRYRLPEVEYSSTGSVFGFGGTVFQTSLIGDGNVLDIVAALHVADRLGIPVHKQKVAVSKLQSVEHRLSRTRRGGITILDDAYNSNPEGAAMALDVLGRMKCEGQRIVVTPGFVEMGESQENASFNLGLQIAAAADILIVVNELNREAIRTGALRGGMDEDDIICVDSLDQAAACVGSLAAPGDIVLYENDLPDTFK